LIRLEIYFIIFIFLG